MAVKVSNFSSSSSSHNGVCRFWLSGVCRRNPCKFLHPESPYSQKSGLKTHKSSVKPHQTSPPQQTHQKSQPQQQLCNYWVRGNCVYGEKCKNLHSYSYGDGFTLVAKLEGGHHKAVSGIVQCHDKLYSVSKDKTMRVWDCNTGRCSDVISIDGEGGTLINEGPWIFMGLPNVVKAWNLETRHEATLDGPVGQVHALVFGHDMLFAGVQDGSILVWKTSSPILVATLRGHTSAVLSLITGAQNKLYSGSMDKTIRVWDTESLQCLQTLHGHSNIVMSVLCWDNYLLSSSLAHKIKIWALAENGKLEMIHERDYEHGILALRGVTDADVKPILLCSCNDNSVRLYDLPTFTERGRIFSKREVRALEIGIGGLFFTGDATGEISVWKLNGTPIAAVPS